MFRTIARASLVALVALALGLATVAPASAGELRKPAGVTSTWLSGAWVWVQSFLGAAPARPMSTATAKVNTSTGNPLDTSVHINTGSCIDPMGNRVPCNQLYGTM